MHSYGCVVGYNSINRFFLDQLDSHLGAGSAGIVPPDSIGGTLLPVLTAVWDNYGYGTTIIIPWREGREVGHDIEFINMVFSIFPDLRCISSNPFIRSNTIFRADKKNPFIRMAGDDRN